MTPFARIYHCISKGIGGGGKKSWLHRHSKKRTVLAKQSDSISIQRKDIIVFATPELVITSDASRWLPTIDGSLLVHLSGMMCTSGMKFLRIPVQWPSILCLILGYKDGRSRCKGWGTPSNIGRAYLYPVGCFAKCHTLSIHHYCSKISCSPKPSKTTKGSVWG